MPHILKHSLSIQDLQKIPYLEAYQKQREMVLQMKEGKKPPFQMLFCEHEPVYTLGRNFTAESMPQAKEYYESKGIAVVETDRGGNITYHGPGQLTVYFLFDLNFLEKNIHLFLRQLEQVVIDCLASFSVNGVRHPEYTGVWVKDQKICAMGVGFRHWISYHGIGFNIHNELDAFSEIIPCGIKEFGVTNLKNMLADKTPSLEKIKSTLVEHTLKVFGLTEGHWQ